MLTDTAIKTLKPKERPYRKTDGRGLFLWITPTGGRLWRWKYRFNGLEKLMSFGQYPDVSLADARERHAAARRLLAADTDPMAARKAEKAAGGDTDSFRAIAEKWLAHWSPHKSARHVATTGSRLETNIYPALGSRPVAEIKAPDIVAMVKVIEKRGAGDLAKRALQTTGQIFRYAVAHSYAERNPVADIKPGDVLKPTRKVNLARIDGKELGMLLKDIEIYQGRVVTRLATKLMALTFLRTSELIGGRWDEIDFEAKRWDIPKERMKMKAPHIVPLSTQALEVLELLKRVTGGGPLMFPGDVDKSKPMSNNTILFALGRMGYARRMTGHGFRGLASTLLHEQGWPHDHIELQLAHAPRNAVSAAYNHALYLEPRAKMMQHWGDFLERVQRA